MRFRREGQLPEAQRLRVRGDRRAMEACLSRGARLARQPAGYREFEEVRRLVAGLRPGAER